MKRSVRLLASSLLLLFLLQGTAAFAAEGPRKGEPLTYTQLRSLLMDYADRYNQMIGQAVDGLQRSNTDPEMRTGIHSIKLFPCSAVYSIAIDADPQMALLNMGIMVHLQGIVWKKNLPKRYGEKADPILAAQKDLEFEYDEIAGRTLTSDKLEWLKSLAVDWNRAHPDQRYVSYIRLTDFSDTRRESWPGKGPNFLSIAGLLSAFQLINMDETTRSVDQARMLGERSIYLAQRMPTILRWQTQMLFYEMANTPENKAVMAATKTVAQIPQERKAALEQFAEIGKSLIWEGVKGLLVLILTVFLLFFIWRAKKKS